MTAIAYRRSKAMHGPVPFGLCGIGTADMPAPDVTCIACRYARRMTARAWRGCAAGHPPHRALEPHRCIDWQPAEVTA
ncbi:hypothetical protein [Metallibacterium scheffleri]